MTWGWPWGWEADVKPQLVDIGLGPFLAAVVGLGIVLALGMALSAAPGPLLFSVGGLAAFGLVYRLKNPSRPHLGGSTFAGIRTLDKEGWLDSAGWPMGLLRVGAGLWRRIPVFMPQRWQEMHTLIVAPPGAGKTELMIAIINSYAYTKAQHSLMLMDPGGGLYARCAPRLAAAGFAVERIHTSSPEKSTLSCDPLAGIPAPDHPEFMSRCVLVTETLLAATRSAVGTDGESYWYQQALNVIVLLIAVRKLIYPGTTLPDAVATFAAYGIEGVLAGASKFASRTDIKLRILLIDELKVNEKARAGVLGTVMQHFAILTDVRVVQTLGGVEHQKGIKPVWTLAATLDRPTAVFVETNNMTDITMPIVSLITTTMMQAATDSVGTKGERLRRPLRFLIDELGNLPGKGIYDLPRYIAMHRSYGIGYVLSVQARSQIFAQYPESEATALIQSCGTVIMLGGASDADAKWYSENRMGKKYTWGESISAKGEHSYHRQVDPLLMADDIRRARFMSFIDGVGMDALKVDLTLDKEETHD